MASGYGVKQVLVTLAGATAQAIGTGLACSDLLLVADTANSNPIYIGASDVTTANGMLIPEDNPIKISQIVSHGNFEDFNLASIFVIGTTGEKLRVLYAIKA